MGRFARLIAKTSRVYERAKSGQLTLEATGIGLSEPATGSSRGPKEKYEEVTSGLSQLTARG